MKTRGTAAVLLLFASALAAACGGGGGGETGEKPAAATPAAARREAGPLPEGGFKAELALPDPPARLRAGQKQTVRVQVRNASDVFWWARGGEINERPDNKFYLAAGNRWLAADGKPITDMDGRHGLGKDLRPGEQTEVPLVVTAPREPGDYTLEVDLVQEQVSWFSDKGSPTAKAKVTVTQ